MQTDLCIYGGTAAGVVAAITAARLKRSVLLIEPGRHFGGMTTGGLGFTDSGNKAAIGGISRDFYRQIGRHYGKDEQWTFEPHVAEQIFQQWIFEAGVKILFEHRLAEVDKEAGRIRRIMLENIPADPSNAPGRIENLKEHVQVEAAMFIDATYEGDLMAAAKVSYTVGRESVAKYNESLNGIRPLTPKHQFLVPVDPYLKPGDPSSGLLPLIQSGDGGTPGEGDARVQAYNFRLCLSRNPQNRTPIGPPENYDARTFEVLGRHLENLRAANKPVNLGMLLKIDRMPEDKTDINNNGAVSTDYLGESWKYPEGNYDARRQIWLKHLTYTQGLFHFLGTDPRIPEDVRKDRNQWGFCKDEFTETAGWPHQIYIREARRMVADYVITQAVCRHEQQVDDSIGLASYNMDSHNCQRIVQNGVVRNEGDVQVAPTGPYPISYRAIIPRRQECENLFVPVCLSASHIAYGSVRMEPVFMLIAQSTAIAADLALTKKIPVQDVNIPALQQRLLEAGQVLKWEPKKPTAK
jgi:ribulose 1,5-bisphosphate synthetase/thiazole synthase